MSPWEARSCPSLIVLSMVRTEEIGRFASKDTSGRSFEPRGRGASNGVLGARRRTEGRPGEPEAATSLHSPKLDRKWMQ